MPSKEKFLDYEPLTPGRKRAAEDRYAAFADPFSEQTRESSGQAAAPEESFFSGKTANWLVQRGHAISFIGIFLFTIAVYLRPYELFPVLMPIRTMASWIAVATILVFVPTQLGLEGNLTARPREVNLLLLFSVVVLLGIPFGDDPTNSFISVIDFLKVVLIFLIMVNVMRTEKRLKWLLFLLLAISCFLGYSAIRNYLAGERLVEGFRVKGSIGNMFYNPNDLALHLVTMAPISIGLFLSTRNLIAKLFYGSSVMLITVGCLLTFSRGGILGLMFALGVVLWKLRRRHATFVFAAAVVLGGVFFVVGLRGFITRFDTAFDTNPGSSAGARRDDLKRSLLVTARNPILGIGIGNYMLRSNRRMSTHNSYTQVSAEVGVAAFVLYVLFMITPIKRLRTLEHRLFSNNERSRFYYLSIGMQASLVGFMVCSFFASVAFLWNIYYLVAISVCLTRIYEIEKGIGVSQATTPHSGLIPEPNNPRMVKL